MPALIIGHISYERTHIQSVMQATACVVKMLYAQ
jgi:hypothetical protein